MDYLELVLTFKEEDSLQKEIFTAELAELGFESFTEEPGVLKAYIQEKDYNKTDVENFLTQHAEVGYNINKIAQQNWNEEWENNYHPIIYQDKYIIKTSFHQIEKRYPIEIIIDPKMSFGTGHHETTSLMVEAMFKLDFKGKTVLDMGTGTGILAILTSILGAKEVTAIDNDEWSYENSKENTEKNRVENVEVIHGDASSIPSKKYDVVLANINRNILLEDLKKYSKHLADNSNLLLSGIYSEDFESINNEAKLQNLVYVDMNEKNNWIVVRYNNATISGLD